MQAVSRVSELVLGGDNDALYEAGGCAQLPVDGNDVSLLTDRFIKLPCFFLSVFIAIDSVISLQQMQS